MKKQEASLPINNTDWRWSLNHLTEGPNAKSGNLIRTTDNLLAHFRVISPQFSELIENSLPISAEITSKLSREIFPVMKDQDPSIVTDLVLAIDRKLPQEAQMFSGTDKDELKKAVTNFLNTDIPPFKQFDESEKEQGKTSIKERLLSGIDSLADRMHLSPQPALVEGINNPPARREDEKESQITQFMGIKEVMENSKNVHVAAAFSCAAIFYGLSVYAGARGAGEGNASAFNVLFMVGINAFEDVGLILALRGKGGVEEFKQANLGQKIAIAGTVTCWIAAYALDFGACLEGVQYLGITNPRFKTLATIAATFLPDICLSAGVAFAKDQTQN